MKRFIIILTILLSIILAYSQTAFSELAKSNVDEGNYDKQLDKGFEYLNSNKVDSCYEILYECLLYYNHNIVKKDRNIPAIGLQHLYEIKEELDSAIYYARIYLESLEANSEFSNIEIANTWNSIGHYQFKLGKVKDAIYSIREAVKFLEEKIK